MFVRRIVTLASGRSTSSTPLSNVSANFATCDINIPNDNLKRSDKIMNRVEGYLLDSVFRRLILKLAVHFLGSFLQELIETLRLQPFHV